MKNKVKRHVHKIREAIANEFTWLQSHIITQKFFLQTTRLFKGASGIFALESPRGNSRR